MTATTQAERETGRGRAARAPAQIPWDGWKDILWRVWRNFSRDRVTLIAAGATFYILLALFPALAAFVSIYGFAFDPARIAQQLSLLDDILPGEALDIIRAQLESLTSQDDAALSFGFIFGFLLTLWSANNGVKTLFEAMNVAFQETEKRSFIRLTLITFLFTLGAVAVGVVLITVVGLVPALLAFVGLSQSQELFIDLVRWPILLLVIGFAISLLYRYGPSRRDAKWRWVTWGSGLATIIWLLASMVVSWYLANFANYNAAYGSLGAIIGFMMWTWISMLILIMGAELDAEIEHQTARDSTVGPDRSMGERGATMADTLGRSREQQSE